MTERVAAHMHPLSSQERIFSCLSIICVGLCRLSSHLDWTRPWWSLHSTALLQTGAASPVQRLQLVVVPGRIRTRPFELVAWLLEGYEYGQYICMIGLLVASALGRPEQYMMHMVVTPAAIDRYDLDHHSFGNWIYHW
jgi:hypothetical protein